MGSGAKRILVLGGTRFLGRAVVESAVVKGHEVTLFNRGQTSPELFPEIEKIRGDRTADVSPLKGIVFGGGSTHTLDVSVDVSRSVPAGR